VQIRRGLKQTASRLKRCRARSTNGLKMTENEGEVKRSLSRVAFMLLAGDIGGTKTLLGLFDALPVRPRAIEITSYVTLDYDDLTTMIAAFLADKTVPAGDIQTACFGVAG